MNPLAQPLVDDNPYGPLDADPEPTLVDRIDDRARPRSRRRRWLILVAVVLAAVAVGAVRGRRNGAAGQAFDPALMVRVSRGDLVIDVVEAGKVQARERVEIKAKVAGQVETVAVKPSDAVTAGQLLLRLDATESRHELARAETELAQARRALVFARTQLDRVQRVHAGRATSDVELDAARAEVAHKAAARDLARVARDSARERLRYTELRAPISGVVTERNIEPGEMVVPGIQAAFDGKPLLTISNLATLIVKSDLNQLDIARVHRGAPMTVTLDAIASKVYRARVTQVAPAATLPKGKELEVFPLEAELEHPDDDVRPGMTAEVRIRVARHAQVLKLPVEAVSDEAGQRSVTRLVSAGGKLVPHKQPVQTGASNDREIEIVSGLAEGDTVLLDAAVARR
jgi:HlyD family secretion protein/macrolide-specific efflux system membrane fusion protein